MKKTPEWKSQAPASGSSMALGPIELSTWKAVCGRTKGKWHDTIFGPTSPYEPAEKEATARKRCIKRLKALRDLLNEIDFDAIEKE